MDRRQLEHVSEFMYFRFVFDELGSDEAECYGYDQVAGECQGFTTRIHSVPVFMYGSKMVI